jgi:uncharacterized protein with FMN-binding domain
VVIQVTTPRHGNEPNKRPASLARRAFPALMMAGAAGALLTQLDRPAGADGSLLTVDAASGADASTAGASRSPSSNTASAPTTVQRSTATTTATDAATTKPSASTTPTTAAPTKTAPAADAASCGGDTIEGPTISTKWGPVQVEAIFATDGSLCDVRALQSPDSHGKSVRINNQALPILHDRVIAAQGTKIYAVSGATITSNAYAASLQSILDGHTVK